MTISSNCEAEEKEHLQDRFKIQIKAKKGKYLGTYIDPGTKMKEIRSQIIDCVRF